MPWRELRPTAAQALLATLGLAMGVALYVAVALVNRATVDRFAENVSSLAGSAALTVRGDRGGFAEQTLDAVEGVSGVDRVVPLVTAHARLPDGEVDHGVFVLGIDMLREGAVRAYGDDADTDPVDDPLEVLNESDAIVVPRALARERSLAVGSPLSLVTSAGPKRFVVRGVVADVGAARAFGGRVVFMDIDAARVSFGKEGRTDRLDVAAKKGADVRRLTDDLARAVGPGLRVEPPGAEVSSFRRMAAAYEAMSADLSRIALVVAAFLVFGTMQALVEERRARIGVLRAIGTPRRALLLTLLAQAALMGLAGGIAGVPLGRAFAAVLAGTASRSASLELAAPLDAGSLRLVPEVAAIAVASGLAAALVGALVPALAACRIACVDALRPKGVSVAGPSRARAAVGALVLFVLAATDPPPAIRDASLSIAFVATALVAPTVASFVLRAASRAAPLVRAPALRLALAQAGVRTKLADASAMLALVLVLVVLIGTAHATVERALADATSRMLAADVSVSESGAILSGDSLPLAADVGREIERIRGVAGPPRALRVTETADPSGAPIALDAWDPFAPERAPIVVTDGDERAAIDVLFARVHDEPAALLSRGLAKRLGKSRGDALDLATPRGRARFRVAGVVLDASARGTIHLARATYARLWNDDRVTAFFVDAAPGTSARTLRDRIDETVGRRHRLVVRSAEDARARAIALVDDGFRYTRAIEAAALLVSLLGLASGALVSVLERRRELAALRAVGMSRAAIARTVAAEMTLVGAAAAATALVLSVYHAHFWVAGVLARAVDWPLVVHVPPGVAAFAAIAGAAAGALAGLVGARRAASIDLRDALGGD